MKKTWVKVHFLRGKFSHTKVFTFYPRPGFSAKIGKKHFGAWKKNFGSNFPFFDKKKRLGKKKKK